MAKITNKEMDSNFEKWVKRLQSYDCYSEEMINEYGELLKKATYGMNEDSGSAYDGSLLDIVLNKLCLYSFNINNTLSDSMKVDKNSLLRVLLLQHISKCEMFIPQTVDWLRKKGTLYEFNPNIKGQLKTGERSAYICMKYGITLSEEEYEAIRVIDKDCDDKSQYYASPLATIVKLTNMLVNADLKENYKNRMNEKNKEEE